MKNYQEFIEGLQKDMTVPEEVWSRFESTLENLPENPVTGKTRLVRWSKMAGAAAAVVVAGTAVLGYTNPVLAAKIPLIGRIFEQVEDDLTFSGEYSSVREVLQTEEETGDVQETESAESVAGTGQAEVKKYIVSDQGVDITLSEVYSDGMSVYITAKINVEQGGLANIPAHYTDRYISDDAATAQTLYTRGQWQIDGHQSQKGLENDNFEGKVVDDHTFIGMIKLDLDEANMDGGVLDLQLNQIGYDDLGELDSEDISESHKIEGTWQLEIPYQVDTELVKQIAVNEKNEKGYGVREVLVSPYQVMVYVDIPYTTLTEEEFSREDFEEMWAEKTEGMDPVPEPPFTYEEYLAQKNYEYYDMAVFNQDGESLMPIGGDSEKMIFAVRGTEITKLNIFMTGDMDAEEMLVKQDMETVKTVAELAVEVDVK